MTIIVKIKKGPKRAFWRVVDYRVEVNQCTVTMEDRPPAVVQGYIESVIRVD